MSLTMNSLVLPLARRPHTLRGSVHLGLCHLFFLPGVPCSPTLLSETFLEPVCLFSLVGSTATSHLPTILVPILVSSPVPSLQGS